MIWYIVENARHNGLGHSNLMVVFFLYIPCEFVFFWRGEINLPKGNVGSPVMEFKNPFGS